MQQLRRGLVFGDENCYVGTFEKDNYRIQFKSFERLMKSTFDAARSVVNYICEVRVTSFRKEVYRAKLDAEKKITDERIRAAEAETEDYISGLQAQLEAQEQEILYEIEQCKLDVELKMKEFSVNFDAAMSKSRLFVDMMKKQRDFLVDVQKKIEEQLNQYTKDYSRRKEFVLFCDEKRKTLELIEYYLREIA